MAFRYLIKAVDRFETSDYELESDQLIREGATLELDDETWRVVRREDRHEPDDYEFTLYCTREGAGEGNHARRLS
jgi:hypothetical protein